MRPSTIITWKQERDFVQIKTLYRYEREKGKTTVSTEKPESAEYTTLVRLIANEGKALTKDNKTFHSCIDVGNQEGWYEVDYNEETEPPHEKKVL